MGLHPLLQRQIRGLYAPGVSPPPEIAAFLAHVDETYRQFDADRTLVERSLELSSQELLQANAEMRLVIQALPDVVMRLDADGTIRSCRTSAADDLVEPAESLLGKRIQQLPGASARAKFRRALAEVASGPGSVSLEYSLPVRGEERIFEARLMPLRGGQVLGLIRNITARRRAETELILARETALEIAHLKSQFLANMSHEIRTPMTCILGMTELALDTPLSPEQREFLEAVQNSAGALLGLLNDILDFSKIEAGRLELEKIPFSLRDSVGAALKSLALRAAQKGLELACHVDPEIPERLMGDPSRLRQVVINLVGNAIKFTQTGEVVVRVQLAAEERDAIRLEFSVRDTGIGIPRDKQRSIFEAFTQADGSMTRTHGGTGLGLAISTQFVQLMGGELTVESEPRRGSTFRFTARFSLELPGATHHDLADPEVLRDAPVLVIDDNAANRQILTGLLKHWGAQAASAAGATDGLAALESAAHGGRPFQLVLLDVQMPEMDGFALAERIQNERPVPIIVLTSAGRIGDAARCRELGVVGYLTKPVAAAELLETIRAIFGGRSSQQPQPLVTRHSLHEDRQRFRLLLAEDNPMNQRVLVRLLEKRGHNVTAVDDGRQALIALETGDFDLVIMDVQMPELDGFAATAAIRADEQGTGRHLPIVALTAHAMKGDRERCLASGMDGYATKPVDVDALQGLIASLLTPGIAHAEASPVDSSKPVFDAESAIERMDYDRSLFLEALALHRRDVGDALERIRSAISAGDGQAIQRTTHRLRGALDLLGARRAADAAARLEKLALARDRQVQGVALETFERELARFAAASEEFGRAA